MRYKITISLLHFDGEDRVILDISGASEETRNLILNNYSGTQYKIISFIEAEDVPSDEKIESLELSVRSYNCLKRAQIHSILDLIVCYNTGKLASVRNLGRRSLQEVEDKLLSLNLVRRNEAYGSGRNEDQESN